MPNLNAAIFLYDVIITTGEEVECFWGRNVTGAAILFWLNKYTSTLFLAWELGTKFGVPREVSICVFLMDINVK